MRRNPRDASQNTEKVEKLHLLSRSGDWDARARLGEGSEPAADPVVARSVSCGLEVIGIETWQSAAGTSDAIAPVQKTM